MSNICPCCKQNIKVTRKVEGIFDSPVYRDPVPHPEKDGWWLYTREDGTTYGASFFVPGKEMIKDKKKRMKLAERYSYPTRFEGVTDWFPAYIEKARYWAEQERNRQAKYTGY